MVVVHPISVEPLRPDQELLRKGRRSRRRDSQWALWRAPVRDGSARTDQTTAPRTLLLLAQSPSARASD
eukprot:2250936-Pyramimonas_sp.AAC.2